MPKDPNESRKYRSILQELNSHVPNRNKEDILESRGQHAIMSAIHLIQMIRESYSEEEAEQLEKRFLSSIRGRDPKRFSRSVQKIKESRECE